MPTAALILATLWVWVPKPFFLRNRGSSSSAPPIGTPEAVAAVADLARGGPHGVPERAIAIAIEHLGDHPQLFALTELALALARVYGPAELPRLRRAFDEAADPMERVFTSLALCVARPSSYPDVAPTLRRSLDDFHAFEPWVARDVLDVLRGVGHREATALAKALALVSDHSGADLARTRAAIDALDQSSIGS